MINNTSLVPSKTDIAPSVRYVAGTVLLLAALKGLTDPTESGYEGAIKISEFALALLAFTF